MAEALLDCLIVGGGPAGLTAALYLARFDRRFLVVDSGASRAEWIPTSHNFPVFSDGVGGPAMLERMRAHVGRYGVAPTRGTVTALRREEEGFSASVAALDGNALEVRARTVLLATGAVDKPPDLPSFPDALSQGLVRFCPICDGYEARGQVVAVIGYGDLGLGEAVFMARTYSHDVSLLTLGRELEVSAECRQVAEEHAIRLIASPIQSLEMEDGGIKAVHADGQVHRFDTLYAALGLTVRAELAKALGAELGECGSLVVDAHNQTSVPGLYAAGDNVVGLNQIVVAMGQASVAATAIHNTVR